MKKTIKTDEHFMGIAINEAIKGGDSVFPNPRVGAVVVSKGEIISKGFHQFFGGPHAEVYALEKITKDIKDAVLYVTLEPCSFSGKTAPCTDLISLPMISRVVIGSLDPNPRVNGSGLKILKGLGIKTEVGVLEKKAKKINQQFFTYHEKKRPYVIIKCAVSLDGYISRAIGDSTIITGKESKKSVYNLRARCDGILVGRKTVQVDNPDLSSHGTGNNPQIVILGNKEKLKSDLKIFSKDPVFYSSLDSQKDASPTNQKKNFLYENIAPLLSKLYEEGMQSLLVEGGGVTITSFLMSGLFDEIHAYISPKIFGEGVPLVNEGVKNNQLNLVVDSLTQFENDVRIIYKLN